jgi:pseudouridine synthase
VALNRAMWRSFARPENDLRQASTHIKAPTLLLFGKHDPAIPAHKDGKAALQSIPSARLAALPCGHASFAEVPELFLAQVQIKKGELDAAQANLLHTVKLDPESNIERRYIVTCRGEVDEAALALFTTGIDSGDGLLVAAGVKVLKPSKRESHVEVTLTEGKNREVRRLFESVGHEVTRLLRVAYGGLLLGDLQPGRWRLVSEEDLAAAFPGLDLGPATPTGTGERQGGHAAVPKRVRPTASLPKKPAKPKPFATTHGKPAPRSAGEAPQPRTGAPQGSPAQGPAPRRAPGPKRAPPTGRGQRG